MTQRRKQITFRCVGCETVERMEACIPFEAANREIGKDGWRIVARDHNRREDNYGLHCPGCVKKLAA